MRRLLFGMTGMCLVLGLTACWAKKNPEVTPTVEGRAEYAAQNPFGDERFDMPIGLEHREGYPELVYIIEKQGRIMSKSLKSPLDKPGLVLDIDGRVFDEGGEQGLLGLAFDPKNPDQAYVNYTTETHTIIARYDADPANPNRLDPDSEMILLTFEQPYPNHNGGQLAFGPDGCLYIATGDGGSGGDPHNNGQNLRSMLGKILRIDVDGTTGEKAYAIPSDNPFIDGEVPEIYAYGLRNPWRFSFDEATGKLWAADVGQNRYEEINLIEKGGNYGWRIQEGTECFNPDSGCDKTDLLQPIHTYGRDEGVSVTGGFVYRGQQLPGLVGWYVYADYGTGTIWALRPKEDGTVENRTLMQSDANITSFGKDASGEIYFCTQEGQILKII